MSGGWLQYLTAGGPLDFEPPLETDDVAFAYATLLEHPELDLAEFASCLGRDEQSIKVVLDRLVDLALLQRGRNERGQLVAVSPVVAMQRLIGRERILLRERQQFLEHSFGMLSSALSRYIERAAESAESPIAEPLENLAAVRRRLEELAVETQFEILSFTPMAKHPNATREASRALDFAVLGRGVRMRTLYPDIICSEPEALRYANDLAAAGAEIQLVPDLPVRLIIIDRETAIVPMNPSDATAGGLLIRHPGTLAALLALFESYWESSRPLPAGGGAAADLDCSQQEIAVLHLLANGAKDEAVAHHLGMSVRTLRRVVADLMTRTKASSRFELGVKAAQRGWL
jgi:DNA-binding CsgD family transcriptional regulator